MAFKVFVSYSTKDIEIVQHLKKYAAELGSVGLCSRVFGHARSITSR